MPLANYTTSVPVFRTLAEIQKMLVDHGAKAVLMDYVDKLPSSVTFRIDREGQQIAFRLPGDWRSTLRVMHADRVVPRGRCTPEHAQRVAWRTVRDWLRAQLALIETGAASMEQVMLPYAVTTTGETLYERMLANRFTQLALPAATATAT